MEVKDCVKISSDGKYIVHLGIRWWGKSFFNMISIPTRMKYINIYYCIARYQQKNGLIDIYIYQNVCLSTTCTDSALLTYWFHKYLMRGNLWSNDFNCIWMLRVVQGPSLTNIGILTLNLLIRVIENVLNKYIIGNVFFKYLF